MTPWTRDIIDAVLDASAADAPAADLATSDPRVVVITHLAEGDGDGPDAPAIARLLAGLPEDSWAVLNGDDARLRRLADGCRARQVWVGRSLDCDLAATHVRVGAGELSFQVRGRRFRLPAWGRHNLLPALAVVAIGRAWGRTDDEIAERLARCAPPSPCEFVECEGVTIIRAVGPTTPASLRAMLDLARECPAEGRRTVLWAGQDKPGDAALAGLVGEWSVTHCGADQLVACGSHAEGAVVAARAAGMPQRSSAAHATVDEAAKHVERSVRPGDVVLVLGVDQAWERLAGKRPARETNGGTSGQGEWSGPNETIHCVDPVERIRVCGNSDATLPPG